MATRPKVKVRTGCLTCKTRRVKCDEGKPSCSRCTTSGRRCDGYTDENHGLRTVARSLKRSHVTLRCHFDPAIDNLLSSFLADGERRWLDHFSSHTGPALSINPDNRSLWSVELPQLSFSEPAIRHALLALSSCHARFETQLVKTMSPDAVVSQNFPIKHYSLAIASLRETLESQSTKPQVPLICCLLFICLECLYGNTALTLTHLENGLKMLDSRLLRGNKNSALNSIIVRLEPMFHKLKAQSTVFGISASFAPSAVESMDFADERSAKTTLDEIITACMGFVRHIQHPYGEPFLPDDDSKRQMQKIFLHQSQAWGTQMESLERSKPPRADSNEASVIMLHVRQEATLIYVALCLDPEQNFCDTFLPRFKLVVDLVERYMDCNNDGLPLPPPPTLFSAFALESSMIPALYLTAIRCRDHATRHRAIGLLERHPGREGLWDARLYAKAARRIVEIEEASLPLQQQSSDLWPDERSRVYRTDVERISEDPVRSARLVFHIAPNGYFGGKVSWSEDIQF